MILFPTKNDLTEPLRVEMVTMLNFSLANAIALQTQAKQAHWNVKGPNFIALYRLFDDVSDALLGHIDLFAERAVQLGGVAEGTAKVAVQRAQLEPYPLGITTGRDHCEALSSALALFGAGLRRNIDNADRAGDAVTSDLYTEVSRETDQWLWMVEAHGQANA